MTLVIIAAATVVTGLGLASKHNRSLVLTAGLIALCLPLTSLRAPFDTRLALVPVTLAVATLGKRQGLTVYGLRTLLLLPAWLCVTLIWTAAPPQDALAQAFFVASLIGLATGLGNSEEVLRKSLVWTGYIILAASVSSFALFPSASLLAGRFRGVFANPNSLATAVVLCTPALLLARRSRLYSSVASVCVFGVVWFSGSRAALLAIAVQIVAFFFSKLRKTARYASGILLLVVAYLVVPGLLRTSVTGGEGSASVLRNNNSRADVWRQSWELVREHLWIGHGLGSIRDETGSSVLTVMAVGGVVSLTILCIGLTCAIRRSQSLMDWRIVTILGALISAIFEGWILAAGTFFCVAFWLTVVSVPQRPETCLGATSRSMTRAR